MASWLNDCGHSVLFAAGWCIMYEGIRRVYLRSKENKKAAEWSCRSICIAHATTAVVLSGLSNLYYGPLCYYYLGQPNTPLQAFTLKASLGYFVFDLLWCVATGGETLAVLAHHMLSIGVCASALVLGESGSEVLGTLFGAEISNPLLQARWFLVDMGMKGTPIHRATDIGFGVVFLFCRVLWAPTLLVAVLRSDSPHALIKAGAVLMQVISWIWSYAVAVKLRRLLSQKAHLGGSKKD